MQKKDGNLTKKISSLKELKDAINSLEKPITPTTVLYKSPYKDIFICCSEFLGLTKKQLKNILLKKKNPWSSYKIFDETFITYFYGSMNLREKNLVSKTFENNLKKLIDDKIIKPDSIMKVGDLDYYLNKMRELNILWIDQKDTKPRKGRYKINKNFGEM